MTRRAIDHGSAAQRLRGHALQHDAAETSPRLGGHGTLILQTRRGFVPHDLEFPVAFGRGCDLPVDRYAADVRGQRAVFRRVGSKLMEGHSEMLDGVWLQGDQRPRKRNLLVMAERLQMLLEKIEQA